MVRRDVLLWALFAVFVACAGAKPTPPSTRPVAIASASSSVATPSSAAPPLGKHLSAKEIFVPDQNERFADRAILAKYGTLRLDPEGVSSFPPPYEGASAMRWEVTVLEKGTTLLRVSLFAQRALRVAGYLEAADFHDVVTTSTPLLLGDGKAPKRARIDAKPGMLVVDAKGTGDRRVTSFDDSYVWIDVSVPLSAMGKVFTKQAAPSPAHAAVAGDEPLLDGPSGPVIGRIAHIVAAPVQLLGEPDGAFRRVALERPTIRVEAWVRTAKVTVQDETENEPEPGSYAISNAEKLAWLPAGTALHAVALGEQVAVCEAPLLAYKDFSKPHDGFVGMRIPFEGWSWITLWASGQVVDKAIASREAAEKRLARIKIKSERVSAGLKQPHYEMRTLPIAACVAQAEVGSSTTVSGNVDVTITVGAQGKPTKVVVKAKPALDAKVAECLEGAFDAEIYGEEGKRAKSGTIEIALEIKAP